MNQKLIFSRLWMLLLAAVLGLGSCADDNTKSDAFTLYYMSIDDIGQSMTAPLVNPTYHGGTPSDFVIDKVTFDGNSVTGESFQVNPENGAISVSNTEALSLGVYKVSISCISGGARYSFNDAFVFSLGKLFPESLSASPEVISITYPANQLDENPVAQISTIGQCVTTTNFNIVQPKGKEYFSITKTGEVALNVKFKGDIPAGDHSLTIKVINAGGSKEYNDVVTFKITSAPLDLSYAISTNKIEIGQSMESTAPTLTGSADDVSYAIASITPAATASGAAMSSIVTIDPTTGVIKADDANAKLAEGETYKISVKATNKYGNRTFYDVFTLEVVGFIQPVKDFAYDASEQVQATAFTIEKKSGFLGDDPLFEFENLAANLVGQVTLDAQTGAISAIKGNIIPSGTHSITVKATNAKGSATAVLALKITANPNVFTYIRYGNNIGVDAATNANQFRFMSEDEMLNFSMPTPTTDCTQSLTWSIEVKHQMATTTIDAGTGALILKGYKAPQMGLVLVTATAGSGATEYSITTPVFFNFPAWADKTGTDQGLTITYNPFVFMCNPRTGGTAPVTLSKVTRTNGQPYNGEFALNYSRTFSFFNFDGPSTHIDGQLDQKTPPVPIETTFIYQMVKKWGAQFDPVIPVNVGSTNPFSYYTDKGTVMQTLAYVNRNDNFKVVVNPSKWIDENDVAANGFFYGQMTCLKANDTNAGAVKAGQQTFPLWIWFDEKFTSK